MKKINTKILVITDIICLLPIFAGLFFYNALPNEIAIHFNVNGEPDNYFPKLIFIVAVPVFMAVLQTLCCICSDKTDKHQSANKKAVTVFKWIIPFITVVLYAVTIMYAMGSTIDIRKAVMAILGIMFVIVGNYTPKVIGSFSKTSAGLSVNKLQQYNRAVGYCLIINGFLFVFSMLFEPIVSVILVFACILELILLTIYFYAKKEKSAE